MDADDADAIVAAMHTDLIGPIESTELEPLAAALAGHGDCSRTLHDLLVSPEHCSRVVADAYAIVLGRAPAATEIARYTEALQRGRLWPTHVTRELLEHVVCDESRPFPSRVASIYAAALGRELSVSEAEFWERRVRRRTPSAVLQQLWDSPEATTRRIAELYRTHLWRDPDQAGISTWTSALKHGGDEPVRAGLVSSLEYRLLARRRSLSRVAG